MMQGWLENSVCMMSGGPGAEPSREEAAIKQEEDRFCSLPDPRDHSASSRGASGGQPPSCASPSTTVLYSPSTNGLTSEFEYGDCVDDLASSPRQVKRYRELPSSPSSPERQFCSSTTSTDPLLPSPEGLKEEEAPKRLCLVCGDIASGFHYGVASCEACKAFFKRTIQGNIEYNCPATNDCEINKRRRKACQACRFHKCLRVGMLKEGVRLDRVRGGRQKYRRTSDSPFAISQMPMKTSLDDIKLLSDLQNCEPDMLLAPPVDRHCEPEYVTLSTLADLYDRELVKTIGWAKLIPGFTALALNDQMRLLQSTWGEILTLTLAFRSIPSSGKLLRYALDFSLDEASARECNAFDLFTQILGVVERLEQCSILKEEYLLLKALVLTNSDVKVQDTQALVRLRQNVLQAIHDAVPSLRTRDATSHMQSLLLCLPSLRAADTCLRRFWHNVRHEGNIALKKLLLEMLETQIR